LPSGAWQAYRLRIRRKRFLLRAWRKRHQLTNVIDRTGHTTPSDLFCFVTLRNEALRLPYFLAHHAWLTQRQVRSFGAIMLDMYPKGPLSAQPYAAGQDPTEALGWYDAGNYRRQRNPRFESEWIQGGVRDRVFFRDRPARAPTLNKVPLVHWNKGYAYVTSTHHMLPRQLNHVFEDQTDGMPTGVLCRVAAACR